MLIAGTKTNRDLAGAVNARVSADARMISAKAMFIRLGAIGLLGLMIGAGAALACLGYARIRDANGAADLNPGPGGAAFPAQVRLYLLRAPDKFSNADYFQLSDHEASVLGGDLISRTEVILHPHETLTVDLATKPDSKYVGVAVAYRNINTATWRAVTPVQSRVRLTLAADRLTLAPQ